MSKWSITLTIKIVLLALVFITGVAAILMHIFNFEAASVLTQVCVYTALFTMFFVVAFPEKHDN